MTFVTFKTILLMILTVELIIFSKFLLKNVWNDLEPEIQKTSSQLALGKCTKKKHYLLLVLSVTS